MIAADREVFEEQWLRMLELQAIGTPLPPTARTRICSLSFELLEDLELDEVLRALNLHCQRIEYVAKPAHIRRIVFGELPSNQVIKALAIGSENSPTPIGVKARSLIGHHTMSTGDDRAIAFATEGARPALTDFHERSHTGEFTDDEIRRMVAAGCRPSGELAPGVPGCRAPYREALIERCRALRDQGQLEGPTTGRTDPDVPEPLTDDEKASADAERAKVMSMVRGMPAVSGKEPDESAVLADGELESLKAKHLAEVEAMQKLGGDARLSA